MALWGNNTVNQRKPQWMTQDEKDELYASENGWTRKAQGGQNAHAQINIGANPADGETFIIGTKTYRFKNTMAQANDVKRGGSASATKENLIHAINLTGTVGTNYYTGTERNVEARASSLSGGDNIKLKARNGGSAGNLITLTDGTGGDVVIHQAFAGGEDATEIMVAITNLRSSITGISDFTITSGGTNYNVGDKIYVNGNKERAVAEVASLLLFGGSAIETIKILKPGAGFNKGDTYSTGNGKITIVSSTGSGANLTAILTGSEISSIAVNDPNGDDSFSESDNLELSVKYLDEVLFADGGTNPKISATFDGNAPQVSKDFSLVNPLSGYADFNHVYRYTVEAVGTQATSTLTTAGQPSDSQVVVAASATYTFKTALTPTAGEVLIGATNAASVVNLINAINSDPATSGISYAAATTPNLSVTASANADPLKMNITAIKTGTDANAFATTTDVTAASWPGATMNSGTPGTDGPRARASAKATGMLTMRTVPTNGDTVTIDGHAYTFKTALTASTTADEVLIGATASASIDNLIGAINLGATSGIKYGSLTALHSTVTASAGAGDTMIVTAKTAGTAGNSIAVSETLTATADCWNGSTLALGRGAEFAVSSTAVTLGNGVITGVKSITGVIGVAATDGNETSVSYAAATDGYGTLTLNGGGVWSSAVVVGNRLTSSGTVSNNRTFTIINVVSTTVIEVQEAVVTEATVVATLKVNSGLANSAINASTSLSVAGNGLAASKQLSLTGAGPSTTETVTIKDLMDNSYVYKFKSAGTFNTGSPATTEIWVLIGASNAETVHNMISAINGDSVNENITYRYGDRRQHPDVIGSIGTTTADLLVTARYPGTGSNAIVIAESATNTAWAGGAVLLSGGLDKNDNVVSALDLSTVSVNI